MQFPEILKPANQYRVFETVIKHHYGPQVEILSGSDGSHRFTFKHPADGSRESCLVVDKSGTIEAVYTLPCSQRQGIARQLLLVARLHLGSVRHSDHLTGSGKAWAERVEGVHKAAKII